MIRASFKAIRKAITLTLNRSDCVFINSAFIDDLGILLIIFFGKRKLLAKASALYSLNGELSSSVESETLKSIPSH